MRTAGLLLLATLLVACSKARPALADSSAPSGSKPNAPSAPQRYSARGTVRSIDADKSMLWIAHEDIPGYMKAMTMPFVAPAALRRDLHPGDRVEFSFHDDGNGVLVIDTLRRSAAPAGGTTDR